VEQPPVPLVYTPLRGKAFVIANTAPLSLQVSWKIHQTLVRPRFKDLLDLIHLLQHPHFNKQTLTASFQALMNECKADNVDLNKLRYFLTYDFAKLFFDSVIQESWDYWRHGIEQDRNEFYKYYPDRASRIANADKLPGQLSDFLMQLQEGLEKHGWNTSLIEHLTIPPIAETAPANSQEHTGTTGHRNKHAHSEEAYNEIIKQESTWKMIKRIFRF
jgi:hypothetical protein